MGCSTNFGPKATRSRRREANCRSAARLPAAGRCPCKQELPLLEGYFRAQQHAGLKVLAVTTEDSLTPYQLKPLQKVLTLPMVKRFSGNYGQIKYLPTNFVIDRAGVLRYAQSGAFSLESLNAILVPLLNEMPPP